jgi:hypothetical protein
MSATNLRSLVKQGATAEAIAGHLDALEPNARAAEATFLGRSDQRRLWDLVEGKGTIRVDDVVPPSVPPMREVVHLGKNTLPLFTRFAKVFCRPDAGPPGELWGYNRNTALIETTVGPGYYVAYDHGDREVLVDYLRQPPRHPEGWPEIIPNSARLSRLVYYGTQDVLRRVSRHVSIGRAMRDGKWMNAWFVLVRQDA